MTIKRVITTKAIASASSHFLSRWTRIEQHSSLRKLQNKISLSCRFSNGVSAMHEAQQHFGCAALARPSSDLSATSAKEHDLHSFLAVGIRARRRMRTSCLRGVEISKRFYLSVQPNQ